MLDCNIKELPSTIENLQMLESLNIHANPMTSLPEELLELPKLREISYDEDKITDEDFKKKLYEHVEKNRITYRKQQIEDKNSKK